MISEKDTFIDLSHYERQSKIFDNGKGKGKREFDDFLSSFKIYKIVDMNTGKPYTAQLSKKDFDELSQDYLINFSHSLSTFSRLNHPSILKFIGYSPIDFKNRPKSVIVTEYVSDRTLYNCLNDSKFTFSQTIKLIIIYGIASAMAYLHSNNIIHTDLTPINIYIDEKNYPKLSNFHFLQDQSIDLQRNSKIIRDFKYVAPEIYTDLKYYKSSDVYSFALIIYELLTDEISYFYKGNYSHHYRLTVVDKFRDKLRDNIPECYQNLIQKCWSHDPQDRPTFDAIVDQLKNNPDFITQDINKEEYENYIKTIDEYKSSLEPAIHFLQLDDLIISKNISSEYEINNNKNDVNPDAIVNLDKFMLVEKLLQKDNYANYQLFKVLEKDTNQEFEAKIFNIKLNQLLKWEMLNFCREINIRSMLNHPSFIKIIGFSFTDFENQQNPVIISEYIYESYFIKYRYDDTKKLKILYGIASAMAYLHSHNIIHRDLKFATIIIMKDCTPKITGFDLAVELKEETFIDDRIVGTPAYLAPEIFLRHEYSKSSDVYSFGLIIYLISTEQYFFPDYRNELGFDELKRKITQDSLKVTFPKYMKAYEDLFKKCTSFDPKERPSFDEIVSQLKNDRNFITGSIDNKDYLRFMKYVDARHASFEPKRRVYKLDEIINSKINEFFNADFLVRNNLEFVTELYDFKPSYKSRFDIMDFSIIKIKDGKFYCQAIQNDYEKYLAIYPKRPLQFFSKNEIINFSREVNIVLQLNHPSILKFIDFSIYFDDDIWKSTPFFVYENHPRSEKQNPTQKLQVLYGIASAMAYLHSHNIIHRDLKLSNIIITNKCIPKITGFNLAIELKEDTFIDDKIVGTPAYLAPEVYLRHEYSKSSDVFSFGFIISEMIYEDKKYDANLGFKLIKESRTNFMMDLPPKDDFTYDLLKKCWSEDPKDRPSFDEIILYLKNLKSDDVQSEEYLNFIKMIDETETSFNSDKKFPHLEEYIKIRNSKFIDYGNICSYKQIFETETNNILFNLDFFDINDYEKNKRIKDYEAYRVHIYERKSDKKLFYTFGLDYALDPGFYDIRGLKRMLSMMPQIEYPLFLKILACCPCTNKDIYEYKPIILTEYAENGTLDKILKLKNKDIFFNETKKLIIIYGIASTIQYLHSIGIMHLNLKPNNIFIDEYLFPKIYGFEHFILFHFEHLSNTNILKRYLENSQCNAPEFYENKCSPASDIFSFGRIMLYILIDKITMKDLDKLEQELKNVPKCYRNMCEMCLSQDPEKRPSIDEIVLQLKTNSEFLKNNINVGEFREFVNYIDEINDGIKNHKDIKNIVHSFGTTNIDFVQLRKKRDFHFSLDAPTINLNKFKKLEKIGKGGFGSVYKVLEKDEDMIHAGKISIYEMDECCDDTITNLTREIEIISKMKHPAILRFIGYNPTDFKGRSKPVIITEYTPNSSLDKILELERKKLIPNTNYKWDDTKKLINIYGIASGMKYLHSLNIIHRDLKPANILLDECLLPKIADFGLSKYSELEKENDISDDDDEYRFLEYRLFDVNEVFDETKFFSLPAPSGFKGTLSYCAPEILNDYNYTKKGDVYAFGMMVYEIITNEVLYQGCNQFQFFLKIKEKYRPDIHYSIPYSFQKLIKKCWSENLDERPSFAQIVHLLETDKGFISQNVNEKEYYDYISYIKNDGNIPITSENNLSKELNKISIEQIHVEDNDENSKYKEYFLDLKNYEKEKIVLKGQMSKLYKVKNINTGDINAAYISMNKTEKLSENDANKLVEEIKTIIKLNHPALSKFIGYSPIDFKKERMPVIITEIPSNGTLLDVLELERDKKKLMNWDDTKKLMNLYGIAVGMSILHTNNLVHSDLTPENIFIDDHLLPKIAYFGLINKYSNDNNMMHQSISGLRGSPRYLAPEILESKAYSKESDVYSYAIIAYEIITGLVPFKNLTSHQIFNEVLIYNNRPQFKRKIPQCYHDLIKKCWSQNPNERPTFDEIVLLLKTDSNFISENIIKEQYEEYINNIETAYKKIQEENQMKIIQEFILSQKIKELIEYLNNECKNELTLTVFEKIRNDYPNLYGDLCKEGISVNNPIAHYNYASLLLYKTNKSQNEMIGDYKLAREHLMKSIKQEYKPSYLLLSQLLYEIFHENNLALKYAKIGANKGDINCKFLYGMFIAHGIGTKKDFMKGVQMMLQNDTSQFYEKFATDFGIYYSILDEKEPKEYEEENNQPNKNENNLLLMLKKVFQNELIEETPKRKMSKNEIKAFKWFEKAFNYKQTKATINNYGICFIKGFGVEQNYKKAKEIFQIGIERNDSNSMYHIAFILEKENGIISNEFYKKAADLGNLNAQVKYAFLKANDDKEESKKYYKMASEQGCHKSQFIYGFMIEESSPEESLKYQKEASKGKIFESTKILAKKYSNENDTENTFIYMTKLIHSGNFAVPLEYATNLYKTKKYNQAFKYFDLLSKQNHPIAKYFIGLMKFQGNGCKQNATESYNIMKDLSNNGIDKATEFIEENFN